MIDDDQSIINPMNILGIFVLLAVVITTSVMILAPLTTALDKVYDETHYTLLDETSTIYIKSLSNDEHIRGSFVLGSGYISGQSSYVFYKVNDKGGYIRSEISTSMSTIYMDENINPHITVHFKEGEILHEKTVHSYDIHVPKGAVIEEFKVN